MKIKYPTWSIKAHMIAFIESVPVQILSALILLTNVIQLIVSLKRR